jgi:hypothetical protein
MVGLKKIILLILIAIMFGIATCERPVLAAGKIADVKISPDLKRVIVKCQGQIDERVSASIVRSSLLVVDFPGAALGDAERSARAGQGAGLEARVSKINSGVRLVLDFGGAAVPEHKIRRVGDYFMVFLGEWTPKEAAPAKTAVPNPSRPPAQRPQVAQLKTNPPVKLGLGSPGFTIKSVEVVDGVIVLQVANRTNSVGNYRIELGINFDQLGFSVANIHPINEFQQPAVLSRGLERLWSKAAVSGIRMGPRKTATEYLTKRVNAVGPTSLPNVGKEENGTTTQSGLSALRKNHRSPFLISRRNHDERVQGSIFPKGKTGVTFHQPSAWTKSVFREASKFSFDPSDFN